MVYIVVEKNNIEKAIKKLRWEMKKAGIIQEYRKRMFYEKPSHTKREKKKKQVFLNSKRTQN